MSHNCAVCDGSFDSEGGEQGIKCAGSCNKYYHARCIQRDVDGAKTRSFRDWRCRDCRASSATTPSQVSNESTKELLKALEDFKQQMFVELKSVRVELNELSGSMQFVSDKMDESTNLMKEKSNLEINGIPETPKENVSGLVRDVGVALGVEIQETDISTAHRVPSFNKDRIPPLIVQFSRRTVRDTLLNKFKDKKTMTAEQINAAFPAQKIYVSEHLTPENKMFLSKLKNKCKEIGYKFAWYKDGKFFVRKCEGERFIRIENDEELNKLK
ncbi:uncharacterized protein LOC124366745 [Homalodisca vitripennis]|uniref:uncharacterized protein LOC124366745 n=1 Tax=Homalodisca vitripennis TaxID=197043 RepID=UPI001EEB7F22|nr:uncharacterized protein LOC124366745 [Homalodisca vitripennis]